MFGDDGDAIEVTLPLPVPLRCGLEVRSPDLEPPSHHGGATALAIGGDTWQVHAFDRRRAIAIMRELSPLLAIGVERRNSFALYDHTFWMMWRSSFHEDRGLCQELVDRASRVGPRPEWEQALAASVSHAASAFGLQFDERLLTACGDVTSPSAYRGAHLRRVAARLELTASERRFVVEAELARPLPQATYAQAPKVRRPALLALRGDPVTGATGRQWFFQTNRAPIDTAPVGLLGVLDALPAEVAECETGTYFTVHVHDVKAITSVFALVRATIQAAANLDGSW